MCAYVSSPDFHLITKNISLEWGFPDGSVVKNLLASAGDIGDAERSPGGGDGNHSSILAWEIPWIEEPGGLQSTGSQES